MRPPATKPHDLAACEAISACSGTDFPRGPLFDDLRPDRFVNGRFGPEQRLSVFEIGGIEAVGEPVVDGGQQVVGFN